jgi:hypothetical protein
VGAVDRENATQAREIEQATKGDILFKTAFIWFFNPNLLHFLCVNVSNRGQLKM